MVSAVGVVSTETVRDVKLSSIVVFDQCALWISAQLRIDAEKTASIKSHVTALLQGHVRLFSQRSLYQNPRISLKVIIVSRNVFRLLCAIKIMMPNVTNRNTFTLANRKE